MYMVRIFMKSAQPDFPCLADEIAELRPDMNIKVAAFTVSEKSINKPCLGVGNWIHAVFCWTMSRAKSSL